MKTKQAISAIILAGTMASPSAFALTSFTNLILTNGDVNLAQDQSGESAYRKVNGQWVEVGTNGTSTVLEVGDVLAGIFFMDSINNTAIGGTSNYTGFTGLFASQITGIASTSATRATFDFGSVTDLTIWDTAFGLTNNTVDGYAIGSGVNVVFGEDKNSSFRTNDFNSLTSTRLQAIAEATALDVMFSAGFGSGTDHYWKATNARKDLAGFASSSNGSNGGDFTFGLDLIDNFTSYTFMNLTDPDDTSIAKDYQFAAMAGSNVYKQDNYVYPVANNIQLAFRVVPEPTSIALLGIGLLSLGASRIRKAA